MGHPGAHRTGSGRALRSAVGARSAPALAHERCELVLGGALADPVDGAALLFRGSSPEVAEEFAQADPYVRNGLVTTWRSPAVHVALDG